MFKNWNVRNPNARPLDKYEHAAPGDLGYILTKRGVFKNWNVRNPNARPLDKYARAALDRTYEFVSPYLRT